MMKQIKLVCSLFLSVSATGSCASIDQTGFTYSIWYMNSKETVFDYVFNSI